jgi:hypothetical protein
MDRRYRFGDCFDLFAKVLTVLAARWVAMTVAFIALLASGRLSGWAPWAFPRVVLALGGVFALEFSSFFLHSVFADEGVLPRYRMIFAVLATALPLCVMAGGFLALRWLFLIGVGAAMLGGIYGSTGETTFMKIKRPFLPASNSNESIDYVLLWVNPMYEPNQLQEVFARIEQRPGWIGGGDAATRRANASERDVRAVPAAGEAG